MVCLLEEESVTKRENNPGDKRCRKQWNRADHAFGLLHFCNPTESPSVFLLLFQGLGLEYHRSSVQAPEFDESRFKNYYIHKTTQEELSR